MATDRTEYPQLLSKLAPGQAVDVLNNRVRQVSRLNTNIAEWLQERSRLEEQYAAGLRRLARKSLDDADLGIFSVPWSTLTNAMDTLADSHSSLAAKIEVDVERPLRDFVTSNRSMQSMTTIQGNLASLARDVERAQQKAEKLQRGDRAETNKMANATSDLDNARAQWDSQAPYVFENLQALDETRVNKLRDLLTQFQTLEVDQVEKNRVAAEQCLNVLLNVETQDEIKTFALKALAGHRTSQTSSRNSFMPGATPTSSRAGAGGPSNALSTIPSNTEEDAGQGSGSISEPQKKGAFNKGLKRLGTVMSRRSSKQPQQLSATPESPERKPKSSPFGRLGRSKDSYSLDPTPEDTASQRPQSPIRLGSEVMEPVTPIAERSGSSRPPQLDPIPQSNGTFSGARSPNTASFPNGSHTGDLADLQHPQSLQGEPQTTRDIAEPPRDQEGYQLPPQILDPISQAQAEAAAADRSEPQFNVNIRKAPIQEEGADAALANMASKLQAPPPTARRAGTVRGRRDARNSAVISTYGAPEQPAPEALPVAAFPTAERAIEPVSINQEALASGAQQPPTQAEAEPLPGSLVQSPSGTFGTFSPLSEAQPPLHSSSQAVLASNRTADNGSIRSGRSTSSQGVKHPELHEPGLNSSIVESVSARFENGKLSTSSLIGEIALAYNSKDFNSSFGHENIRLENFSSLEKVAPNPAFINQPSDREGEYSVNLANLAKTQIAFKYQLRHDDASSHVPLLVTPACKIEAAQTSVIVSYSLHPGFSLPSSSSLTLSNVVIALTLEGAKASQCQNKPLGTFNRDRNLIYWQVGDLTLTPGAAPEKLLARFATDSEAKGASVEARWDIVGDYGSPLGVSAQTAGEGAADPFADESGAVVGWKPIPAVRKLTSGNYVAKS